MDEVHDLERTHGKPEGSPSRGALRCATKSIAMTSPRSRLRRAGARTEERRRRLALAR